MNSGAIIGATIYRVTKNSTAIPQRMEEWSAFSPVGLPGDPTFSATKQMTTLAIPVTETHTT